MRSGFWRKCRVCFRWCRISVWLVVLATLCAVVWFNQIGLPDVFKARLVAALRERGWDLEFTRMRLRFDRGIVAENVRLGDAQTAGSPFLSLAEIQLQLNFRALLQRRLQVDGLGLRQGRLTWPISPTNVLRLDNIRSELRFQINDTWSLDNFSADFAGAKLALSGDIGHAPELRDWEMFHGGKTTDRRALQSRLEQFSDMLRRIHFDGTPQLDLTLNGDARDLHSFVVKLKVMVPGTQTPWFTARDLQLTASLTAPATAPANADPAWGFWTNLQPYRLEWSARLTQLQSEKLKADFVAGGGFWNAPEMVVTDLAVELGDGRLVTSFGLNVATRELTFTNSSCFNLSAIAALLPEPTRARLADFKWTQPPVFQVGGALVLPAWTNASPDWNDTVRSTVRLNGALALTNGVVMGAAVDSASTHFSYSNLVWRLPDLALVLAKTRLELGGSVDEATKNYRCHIRGVFDLETARPFLTDSNVVHGLAIVTLNEPPVFDVTVAGRLTDFDSVGVEGHLALTNFAVRGEAFGDVMTDVNYTNRVLEFLRPLTHNGAQTATGDSVTLDFNQRLIFFTNALSSADPYAVTRAIGPKTAALVTPYHFFEPPTARVNGQIPLGDMHGGPEMAAVDMTFDIVKGGAFQWERLRAAGIIGTLHWRGQTLLLTNVLADCYGGTGTGYAYFDFSVPHEGADYDFLVDVTNINLHALAADLWSPTNKLEGALAGTLVVTNASTEDLQSWNGHGRAHLRDGLLWDIPIFGILSPVLNSVSSGLGSSRATEAAGKYVITNGVIRTDSLLIRSTMARLEYVGTIDLQQNVDARVTAQLLRNTWVVGPLVSTMLWPVSKLFEYHVTGTLGDPKSVPVYVLPKLLLVPLHPLRTLEEIVPGIDSPLHPPPGN
jgi:hypothetical protein